MSGLSEILKVITYAQWGEVQWSLNAIEEYKHILQSLKNINTEAEMETILTDIEDEWAESDHRDKYLSLWSYQFNGDLEGAIEEVERWITYKIQDITQIVSSDKIELFNEAYAMYLNDRYNLISTDTSLTVDRIISKDYTSEAGYETTHPDVIIEKFENALGCKHLIADNSDIAEMRIFILRRHRNGIVDIGSGFIDLDQSTAVVDAKEIHCITLQDSKDCYDQLREITRTRTSTAFSGRTITGATFGSLTNSNVHLEVGKDDPQ